MRDQGQDRLGLTPYLSIFFISAFLICTEIWRIFYFQLSINLFLISNTLYSVCLPLLVNKQEFKTNPLKLYRILICIQKKFLDGVCKYIKENLVLIDVPIHTCD